MNPVYNIFNDITKNMLTTENGEEFISNCVTLKGATGTDYELSINQAQLLLGVLNGDHNFLRDYNPLEFMIFSYQFQDKIKPKYLAVQYQIIYDHEEDTIFISAVLRHPMTVKAHPDYVEGATVPIETFQTTIENVGLYGSLALINCIAAQNEQFAPIKGSFGGSFVYELKDGQQTIKRWEPSMLEETGIGEAEIQEAIGDAVKKLTPYNFNALPKLRPGAIEDDSEGDESYAGMYRGADGEMHPIALLGKEEQ
ncbi:hypothetical protein D3C81_270530 [compost metagenome]